MTECSHITAIHFVFTRCPLHPEVHSCLNSIHSCTLPDHQKIYVDPDTQTEIKPNSQLLETVCDILTTACIGPDALDATDEAAIRPLINKCTLSVNVGNQFQIQRLTKANLGATFEFAITNNRLNDIRLSIGIHGLHFRPGLNYREPTLSMTQVVFHQQPQDILVPLASRLLWQCLPLRTLLPPLCLLPP